MIQKHWAAEQEHDEMLWKATTFPCGIEEFAMANGTCVDDLIPINKL